MAEKTVNLGAVPPFTGYHSLVVGADSMDTFRLILFG